MRPTTFPPLPWLSRIKQSFFVLLDYHGRCIYRSEASENTEYACDILFSSSTHSKIFNTIQKCKEQPNLFHELLIFTEKIGNITWQFKSIDHSSYQDGLIAAIGYPEIIFLSSYSYFPPELLCTITDGLYVVCDDFRIAQANPVAQKILFSENKELYGTSIWELIPKLTNSLEYSILMIESFLSQQSITFEDFQSTNNTWYKTTFYPSPSGLIVLSRDVTESKLTKDKIRISETKLRAILDSTQESNFLIDKNFKILCMNKFAKSSIQSTFGFLIDEGHDIRAIVPDHIMETFLTDFQRALNGEHLLNEILLHFPEGERWYKIGFSPAYDTENILIGVSFTASDIHETKMAHLNLEEQYNRLEEIADIQSHMVRRPVASIIGLLSLINPETLDTENQRIFDHLRLATDELDTVIHAIIERTEYA